jgi:hypothetical protein
MTDIVERLREGVWGRARRADAVIQTIMQEGADEIERLRNGIHHALTEIEDGGPKALKYAAQELRIALGEKDSD